MTVTGCHSALDAESRFFSGFPPFLLGEPAGAGAGMTIFYTAMLSIEEFSD
jgi:hypothetical protein